MKTAGSLRQLGVLFVGALVAYAGLFHGIEGCRTRRGPWQVAFTNSVVGAPVVVVNQPGLGITNVQLVFAGAAVETNAPLTLAFAQVRRVPFDVPFGRCVFLDTISLPGTVTFELLGHEVELLPRVLVVDRVEQPWRSWSTTILASTNPPTTNRAAGTPHRP